MLEENSNDDGQLSIQEMLDSNDPVLVEYAKELQASSGQEAESTDENHATSGVDESTEKAKPNAEKPAESENEEAQEPQIDGVIAKDGKNYMPYSVVEQARAEAAQAKKQLEDANRQLAEISTETDKLKRQYELAKKNGIDLPTLPEDEKITQDMVDELNELSPELGLFGRKMLAMQEKEQQAAANVNQRQKEVDSSDDVEDPEQQAVRNAVQGNRAIQHILNNPQMKQAAIAVEQSLLDDSQFDSLEARYAEVAKRVGGAFGIDFGQLYGATTIGQKAKAPSQNPATPQSLSDMPAVADHSGKSPAELLAERSEGQLISDMDGMTQAQVEELLFQNG